MSRIFIYGADKPAALKNKKLIKQGLLELFERERIKLERLNYIFCSDNYLLEINRKYLKHDFLTDVITFPLSKKNEPIQGEVYISLDGIKENAKLFNALYQNELLRVMIHGALHLCGYRDKTNTEKLQMRQREDYYLTLFNVSRESKPNSSNRS